MPISHNLGSFARRIRKVAADVEPAVDDTLRKVALVANQTVVMATPVDTGRARANWQISIDTTIDGEVGDMSAQAAITRNAAVIKGYRNGAIILQNNVPYISALNNGSSAQAPAGFVEKAIQAAANAVSKAKVVR
jgi:HK97 gp10 family phage protein